MNIINSVRRILGLQPLPHADAVRFEWRGELRRMEIKPGDRFVLMFHDFLTPHARNYIREQWAAFMDEDPSKSRLIILEGGAKIGICGHTEDGENRC